MLHAIMTSCFSIRVTTQNLFIGTVNEFNFSSITRDQDQIDILIYSVFEVVSLHFSCTETASNGFSKMHNTRPLPCY